MEAIFCEENGTFRMNTNPVSISYISVPKLHQSTAVPCPCPRRTSGANK